MRKIFPLKAPNKADARVVESVKHEVRKYVRRERRKALPEDFDEWTFRCQAGATPDSATRCELKEIGAAIDAVANAGGPEIWIEVIAEPGQRRPAK